MSRVTRSPMAPPPLRPGAVGSAGPTFLPALLAQPLNGRAPPPVPELSDVAPPAVAPAPLSDALSGNPAASPADCWEGMPSTWALGLQALEELPPATTPTVEAVSPATPEQAPLQQAGAGLGSAPPVAGQPLPLPAQSRDFSAITATVPSPLPPVCIPDSAPASTRVPAPSAAPPIDLSTRLSFGRPAQAGLAPVSVPPAGRQLPWPQVPVPAESVAAVGSPTALAEFLMPTAGARARGAHSSDIPLLSARDPLPSTPSMTPLASCSTGQVAPDAFQGASPSQAATPEAPQALPGGLRATPPVRTPPVTARVGVAHTVADGRLRVVHDLTAWAHGWLDQLSAAASEAQPSDVDNALASELAAAATRSWLQPAATFVLAEVLQPAISAASWQAGGEAATSRRVGGAQDRTRNVERKGIDADAPPTADAVPLAPRQVLLAVNEDGHCTAYVRDYQSAEPLIERLVEQLRRIAVSDGRTLLRIVVNGRAYHDHDQSRGDPHAG